MKKPTPYLVLVNPGTKRFLARNANGYIITVARLEDAEQFNSKDAVLVFLDQHKLPLSYLSDSYRIEEYVDLLFTGGKASNT